MEKFESRVFNWVPHDPLTLSREKSLFFDFVQEGGVQFHNLSTVGVMTRYYLSLLTTHYLLIR